MTLAMLKAHLGAYCPRNVHECRCPVAVRFGHNSRFPSLAVIADVWMQRYVSKEIYLVLGAQTLDSFVGTKHICHPMTVGTFEERHVLYEAEDIDVHSFEHVDALDGILCCEGMWRRDD